MSYSDYSIETEEMQEILQENLDKLSERVKFKNDIKNRLAGVLTDKQFEKFAECGRYLATGHNFRVVGGNFCRNRLCPVCNRRNSAQKWAKMFSIAERAKIDLKPCFAFLTVTVKNVSSENLASEISRLMRSIDRLHKRALFINNVYGFFRSLEITYNSRSKTFHPHYHYVLALPGSYKENLISTYEWRTTWEKCARLDYNSQVDIRLIEEDNLAASVAEVAKYAVKISSVIEQDKPTLKALQAAIRGRRLISFGGVFKEYAKESDREYEKYDMSQGYEVWGYNSNKKQYERGADHEDRAFFETWQISE